MHSRFKNFLKNLETKDNKNLLEAVDKAFSLIFESLSTDDANPKQNPTNEIYQDPGPAQISLGQPETTHLAGDPRADIPHEEYFDNTIENDKLKQVKKSQLGAHRMSVYPQAGRTISGNDYMTNQYGANQNTYGVSGPAAGD